MVLVVVMGHFELKAKSMSFQSYIKHFELSSVIFKQNMH